MFSFRRAFTSSANDLQKELEKNLKQVKEIDQIPNDLDFHRTCNIPKANTIVALNDMTLTIWDICNLKKKGTYSVPRLVFSSLNLTFIEELKFLIITLRSNECSIFSLRKDCRLVCKSPVALPYTEYIHPLRVVVSFGKDLLSIWGIYNRKLHYKTKGSFHIVKYLNGLNKLATFEGLFCELYLYDIDKDKKTLTNRKLLYSNDSTYGCLNQLEWIEQRNILIMSDSVIGTIKLYTYRDNRRWEEVTTIEKEGILYPPIKMSTDVIFMMWEDKKESKSFIFDIKKMKTQTIKQKVGKICFYSPEKKSFVASQENKLCLWKF